MLEFQVTKGQGLWRTDKDIVSADTTDLKAHFTLTADFTGTITAWWRRSDANNTYTSTLAADGTCTIPAEALAATDKAVYGPYDHDVFVSISDTGRTTTNEYKLTVQRSAFSTTATPGTGGSPTAYEELVEQFDELKEENQTFKDDMTQQQETFESTVTEDVDNIRYIVETETAPPIIEEASGTEITLEDSAYRQVRGLQLYGYSRQTQTTGAQLIPDKITTGTASGVKMTLNSDGSFTLNGTNTGGDKLGLYFVGGYGSTTEFLPTGNYFYKVDGLNEGDYCIVRGTDFESINSNPVNISQHNITQLGINVSPGTTYNNAKIYPMLNTGSSALPWEPYSGGYASPSPDWAQPIHSGADEVNLANLPDVESVSHAGVTWACKDGVVTVNGTANGNSSTADPGVGIQNILTGTKGTFYVSGSSANVSAILSITKDGSTSYNSEKYVTLDGTETGVRFYLQVNSGKTANNETIYPMLNVGSAALPWRPHGHNVIVESQGANLIDLPKNLVSSYGGISVKGLGDGTFLYSGTATGKNINVWLAGGYGVTTPIIALKKGEYSAPLSEASFYSNTDYLNANNVITVPDGGMDITGIRAPNAVTGTNYNKIIYPMLNRGSTPLPWQPYAAPSSALISLTDSLRGIPVDSGGTYTDDDGQQWIADYIYRRQTDGKWCLWRNCGAVVYDGSSDENWRVSTAGGTIYVATFTFGVPGVGGYMTNFVYQNGISNNNSFEVDSNKNLRVYAPDITSIESWNAWIASNPQTVVYQIATPTIEELPDDVQAELNGLYTYNLHTDMWNNDGAYMGLKYVADTKTWINNKIAGLSTAMLNQN